MTWPDFSQKLVSNQSKKISDIMYHHSIPCNYFLFFCYGILYNFIYSLKLTLLHHSLIYINRKNIYKMLKWKFMPRAIIILEVGLKGKDVMLSNMHKEEGEVLWNPLHQTFNQETVKNAINHNTVYPPSYNFVQKACPPPN